MKQCFLLWLVLCLVSQSFGLGAGKYKITSFSRIFYDDNVFMRASSATNKTDTIYYSQSLGIDAKFFNDKITLKGTPEIRHRLVDNKTQYFGSLAVKGKQELGPKIVVETANTFAHAEREPSSLDDDIDVTYFSNKHQTKVSWQPRYLTKLRYAYDNHIKRWSENLPLGQDMTNGDFTKQKHSLYIEQIIGRRFISELIGTTSQLNYNGTRGGIDSDTIYGQLSYVPNSFMIIKGSYGRIYSEIENQDDVITEYSVPMYGANVTFFTPRGTTLGFNMIYEVMDSSVGYWNMKENLKLMMIAKYPITPKLEVSAMLLDMHTTYKDIGNRYSNVGLEREEEVIVSSITFSWRYNEFHYAEVGYQGMHLFNDDADVFKNKVFLGYRFIF